MPKSALKKAIAADQDLVDPITGEPLSTEPELIDTDRILPKAQGGTYDSRTNVRVLNPRSHMERHGNLRERVEALDALKSLFDDRVQMMKLLLKENNQMLAYTRRVDHQHPETAAFLAEHLKPVEARIADIDKALTKLLKTYPDPLVQTALKVKGLGPITVAALTAYIDFHKEVCSVCHKKVVADQEDDDERTGNSKKDSRCRCKGPITLVSATATPSSLWKYVGLHVASHERYTKGEAGGGNKTLRTVLYNTACVMMKMKDSPYREIYDRTKLRLSQSEKLVMTRNTSGRLVELPWREAKPSHRHGAALRAIIKHLLADYWLVGRTLAGLPTPHLYAQAVLGHTHIISPRERGWEY